MSKTPRVDPRAPGVVPQIVLTGGWGSTSEGDTVALDISDLYERYGHAVHRRCRYFLRNDEDALDAMHDVFLKIVEREQQFRGDSAPLTWIIRITTNHCLNRIRSQKAAWRERYQQTVTVDAEGRPGDASRLERADLVYTLLLDLDNKAREAAIYYFVDEMNQEDAALAAGCSVPTLRKRLRAFIKVARRKLRDIDADAIFGPPPL